jgi:hypothetical protein
VSEEASALCLASLLISGAHGKAISSLSAFSQFEPISTLQVRALPEAQ